MARIRSIKPGFFTSDDVARLPFRARLTWIGLWTHCDDAGRCKDHVTLIKSAIWPLDNGVSLGDIEEDLACLASEGRIVRYEAGGQRYLAIVNWGAHQSINRPTQSRIPAPPIDSVNPHGGLTEGSPWEGKGGEGKGKGGDAREAPPAVPAPPPPRSCATHPEGTEQPCRRCGTARKAFEAWEAEQAAERRAARTQAGPRPEPAKPEAVPGYAAQARANIRPPRSHP